MPIDLSIIMPVYNYEKLVTRAINSVLSQKDIEIELIIVEDCSTDNSYKVVEDIFNKHDPDTSNVKMKLYRKVQNGGAIAAIQLGETKVTGRYIHMLAADDHYLTNVLGDVVKYMDKTGLDVLAVNGQAFTDDGEVLPLMHPDTVELFKSTPAEIFEKLQIQPPGIYALPVIRSTFYYKFGGMPDSETGDWPTVMNLFAALEPDKYEFREDFVIHCWYKHNSVFSGDIKAHLQRKLTDANTFIPEEKLQTCLANIWKKYANMCEARGLHEDASEAFRNYRSHYKKAKNK